jgi:hypothetical protein
MDKLLRAGRALSSVVGLDDVGGKRAVQAGLGTVIALRMAFVAFDPPPLAIETSATAFGVAFSRDGLPGLGWRGTFTARHGTRWRLARGLRRVHGANRQRRYRHDEQKTGSSRTVEESCRDPGQRLAVALI